MTPRVPSHSRILLFKDNLQKRAVGRTDPLRMGLAFITEGAIPLRHRPDSCTSVLYRRFRSSWSDLHVLQLYTDGTTWRNLRIPGCTAMQ